MFHEVFNSREATIGMSTRRAGRFRRHSNVNLTLTRANTYKLLAIFGSVDVTVRRRRATLTAGCQHPASVIRCIHART
jgi:hypothetical protein